MTEHEEGHIFVGNAQPVRGRSDSFIPLEGLPEAYQSFRAIPTGYVRGERDGVLGFVREDDYHMLLPRDSGRLRGTTTFPTGHPEMAQAQFASQPSHSVFGQPSSAQSQPAMGSHPFFSSPVYHMPPPQVNQYPSLQKGFGPHKIKIPTFGNKVEEWNSLKNKCVLYKTQMSMNGHEHLAGINILSSLTGTAWQLCEHFLEDVNLLNSPQLFDAVMNALAARYQESDVTKLPAAFDNYFLKGHRKSREPLNEYIVRHNQSRIKFFALTKVDMPAPVDGWLLLRRAGLNSVETSLVMSQLQGDLANDRVSQVLELTFGQQSLSLIHI